MSEELALAVKDAVSVVNDPHMGVSIVEMGIEIINVDLSILITLCFIRS